MTSPRKAIAYVDVHAAGEPGRVLVGSGLLVRGTTMAEKFEHARTYLDGLRHLVLREPRGYPALCAVLVTAPCDPRADVGIIVLEQPGFRPMSGSNTICAVTALLETGALPITGSHQRVVLDTAVGLVEATATIEHGKVVSVSIRNVPAFVEMLDHALEVPHLGTIDVDVAFGGQFYVQARADHAGVELEPSNAKAIARAGALIRQAAREQIPVKHPDNPAIDTIDLVMLHGPSPNPDASGRNAVVCFNGDVDFDRPETWTGSIDRSPCGTGTSARMAALHARGQLNLHQPFIHESLIGTRFTGHLVEEIRDHPRHGVRPVIAGSGWITNIGQLVVDETDPFPTGYTLADLWSG